MFHYFSSTGAVCHDRRYSGSKHIQLVSLEKLSLIVLRKYISNTIIKRIRPPGF